MFKTYNPIIAFSAPENPSGPHQSWGSFLLFSAPLSRHLCWAEMNSHPPQDKSWHDLQTLLLSAEVFSLSPSEISSLTSCICLGCYRAWQRSQVPFPLAFPFGLFWTCPSEPSSSFWFLFISLFWFLATLQGIWDHSSPTRDWTCPPPAPTCSESMSVNHWTTREILRLKQSLFYESSLFKGWHLFFSI